LLKSSMLSADETIFCSAGLWMRPFARHGYRGFLQ
jgi:hypothetical protein